MGYLTIAQNAIYGLEMQETNTKKSGFFAGTSKGMRLAFLGFCIAAAGGALGFLGFSVSIPWLALIGYLIVVIGVVIGFAGILVGWFSIFRGR
jgi:hypothetical protein